MKLKLLIIVLLMTCAFQTVNAAPDDIVKKGRLLQKAGKYDEALKTYKKSLKRKPSIQVYVEAGSLLGKMHKYRSAEAVLNLALKDFPENTSLMNLLALIKMRKGDKKNAIKLWNQVIEFNPNNAFAKKWLKKSSGEKKPVANKSKKEEEEDQTEIYSPSPTGVYNPSRALSKVEQQKLATKLYKEMLDVDKWDIDEFIRLHKQVVEQCPDTDQAQESCWRLSNLYLLAEDPPNFQEIVNVLEYLLKEYPDSPLMPDAKNRLLLSYQKLGESGKVVELYKELFTKDPDPADDKIFMVRALEFAQALEAEGKTGEADKWYQKIIEKDNGRDMLEARVAKDKLSK